MSLLLDARKKSLQAQPAQQGDAPAPGGEQPPPREPTTAAEEAARSASQNLFAAKFPSDGSMRFSPRLLLTLGGAILLLGSGAYLWLGTAEKTVSPPAIPPKPAALAPSVPAPPTEAVQLEPAPSGEPQGQQSASTPAASAPPPSPQPRETPPASPVRIEREHIELLDPQLRNAYQAYRSGKLDEAQQMYLDLYRKDAQNADALLGLAAIAQQRGEYQLAAQYYAGVLRIDPRNAAANAGMASLNEEDDDNNESRLKLLLREQGNSAVLHFALGNLYAGQSRWGEAQQAFFNAVTLEPGNAEFAYNLAVSLDHLGQAKPAVQYYQRAMQLDTLHSAGFDHAQVSRRIEELNK
jgi:Flp pilus assembly protein TadD